MKSNFVYKSVNLELSQIALEANVLSNMVTSIRNIFPSLLGKLSSSFSVVNDIPSIAPQSVNLGKDQKFVLKEIEALQYLDIAELRVNIPEDFDGNFIDYTECMIAVAKNLRGIVSEVLQPYNTYLAQFLSNKSTKLSTHDLTHIYFNLSKRREASIEAMDKFKSKQHTTSSAKLGTVINRKNDLAIIYKNSELLLDELKTNDLKLVQTAVKTCVDLLNMILTQVEESDIQNVTPDVTKNLAIGAAEIAYEVEFLAMTHYRTLSLIASVDSITETLVKYIKGNH